MSLHADLLDQAEQLAQLDPRRPKQANLRLASRRPTTCCSTCSHGNDWCQFLHGNDWCRFLGTIGVSSVFNENRTDTNYLFQRKQNRHQLSVILRGFSVMNLRLRWSLI